MPKPDETRTGRSEWYRRALRNLGAASLVRFQVNRRRWRTAGMRKLTSRMLVAPVYARRRSSDFLVFEQIFIEREYRCLDHVGQAGLILDCGANVGYSAAYFLSRYPQCHLIAIEPDVENFELLVKNLTPYPGRHTAVRAAVWPRSESLQFTISTLGEGKEWARAVEADISMRSGGAAHVSTVQIPTLLAMSDFDRISILKMDVEGAELEIFGSGSVEWLDLVDNIVIELHGPECSDAFYRVIRGHNFEISTCGELTVCCRR